MSCCEPIDPARQLKAEIIAEWIEQNWKAERADERAGWITLQTSVEAIHDVALQKFDREMVLDGGWRFLDAEPVACEIAPRLHTTDYQSATALRSGAMIHRFKAVETGDELAVLTVSAFYKDDMYEQLTLTFVCLPPEFDETWRNFAGECYRLANVLEADNYVVVVGGRSDSFVPTVEWDQVVLPAELKDGILNDVESFFTKGIGVYNRLNLKPFRKLLLAGVPGTGKTMICNALAKWALARGYLVIYVSSARKGYGEVSGANFGKIDQALSLAAYSGRPTMLILEEMDAYLHAEEKALILNVLDGAESAMNPRGTLLVATTNYPEAIDERILKRPGRLDRVFIIPEQRVQLDVEKMLRQYLGVMWRDEHIWLVPKLVGYPGAFIREVAVYALTQLAYDDGDQLSLEMLEGSFQRLKDQIETRDDFLKHRIETVGMNGSMGVNGSG